MGLRRRTLLFGMLGTAVGGGLAGCGGPTGPVLDRLPALAGPGRPGYVVAACLGTDPGSGNALPWRVLNPATGAYTDIPGTVTALSPDLRYALAYHFGDGARIHDTATGAVVHDFGSDRSVPLGWSPDGRHIVLAEAAFHDVHSMEDNYHTLDVVRLLDVTTGTGRVVEGWTPVRDGLFHPWPWTTGGRLVVGDRLVGMNGGWRPLPRRLDQALPVLGTDRFTEPAHVGEDEPGWPRGYATVGVVTDVATGLVETDDRRIDARVVRPTGDGPTGRHLAWRDRDGLLVILPRELIRYDLRDRSERVVARFPVPTYDVRIAPAATATALVPTF